MPGNIATEAAARATPDGHTLLMGVSSTVAANRALYRSLPVDTVRDDTVRYVLPGAILLAGIVALLVSDTLTGLEGLAMGIGVAASVLLLNVLYRIGVKGDLERDDEEAARVFYDEHGRWPDEAPRGGRGPAEPPSS